MLKALLDDSAQVAVRQLQDSAPPDVEGELLELFETRSRQLVCQGARSEPEVPTEPGGEPLEEPGRLRPSWSVNSARI